MTQRIRNTPALNVGLKIAGLLVAVQLVVATTPTVV